MGDDFSSMTTKTPWVASIGYISGSDWRHECTANIISKNMIVTIAQCVENVDNSTQIKVGSEVFYDIESVDLHPDFNGNQFNIAIVYTTQNIEFSDKTRPICVPQFAEEDDDGLDGKAVRISGWTPMGQQNRLVPIRDNSFCHPLDNFPNQSNLCARKNPFGGLGLPIAIYNYGGIGDFYQLIGLKLDDQDDEDEYGWFVRMNHPKILEFLLPALLQ